MPTPERYEILIVGAGPAGSATALWLAQRSPELAARTLVLEAATHPRRKICGGAVTAHGEQQLAALGVHVDVPAAPVDRLRFQFGGYGFGVEHPGAMRVVQRSEFDAALAGAVSRSGVELRCGEPLVDLRTAGDGVEVTTPVASYRVRAVVAADGARSVVRRRLGVRSPLGVARLLQVLTPVDPERTIEFAAQAATFDFSCVRRGVQGYAWDFPCYVDGRPHLNSGIFDCRITELPRARLKDVFVAELARRGVDAANVPIAGYPVRWFNPGAEFARPHVLLTGDAAGVDPLFAEGISYALEYGAVAADALAEAFASDDWSFASYRRRLLRHRLGRMLRWKLRLARAMYGRHYPLAWSLIWRLASIAPDSIRHAVGTGLGVLP